MSSADVSRYMDGFSALDVTMGGLSANDVSIRRIRNYFEQSSITLAYAHCLLLYSHNTNSSTWGLEWAHVFALNKIMNFKYEYYGEMGLS